MLLSLPDEDHHMNDGRPQCVSYEHTHFVLLPSFSPMIKMHALLILNARFKIKFLNFSRFNEMIFVLLNKIDILSNVNNKFF